jgi:hypothetical protein
MKFMDLNINCHVSGHVMNSDGYLRVCEFLELFQQKSTPILGFALLFKQHAQWQIAQ